MDVKRPTSSQDAIGLLALLAMVVWFSQGMIWEGKIPFYRDLSLYFYPIRFSLAQSFHAGELPLWDRHIAMGFPLLADFQSAAFYPPHIFYLILPFFSAINVNFLFHYSAAATGSYLLCRWWRYPPYLAIVGAILFTFGGTIISLTNVLNHFQTAVWLPWLVFSWERLLLKGSGKNFLFFVLISLLQFLAGSPEIYVMSVGLAFLDGLRIRSTTMAISHRRAFSWLLAANALVAGLSMVQILPTAELFFESRGYLTIPLTESTIWSLHPLNLVNLFFLDKEVNTAVHNGLHLFFFREIPFLISYYMGAIVFLGICLGFFYSSWKEKGLLLGLIIIFFLFALGSNTPVYQMLFRYVPLFSLFRFPEKFFFLVYGLVLFIALRGLFDFLQPDRPISRGPILVLSLGFLPFFLLYLFVRHDTLPLSLFIARATATPLFSTAILHKTTAAVVNLERQVVLIFGFLLLFFLWKGGRLRKALFEVLLPLLVFVDLNSAHQPYQYLLEPGPLYDGPRILQSADSAQSRFFYYPGDSDLHPNYYSLLSQPSFAELSSLVVDNLLPNTGVLSGIDYMQEIDALRRWPYLVFLRSADNMPPDRLYKSLAALNVRYIVSFRTLPGKGIALVRHFPEYPSWLYRLDRTVPRVYVASKAIEEKNPLKIPDHLSSAEFDPLKEVFLDRPLAIPAKKGFQGRAEIVQYTNQRVSIRAFLNGSGVLVLADSFYPGWRVYVDGKEGEILRANLLFRGVALSEGEHVVEFRYQPRSFKIGLAISLFTLCGLAIFSFAPSTWRRRLYRPFAL